MSLFQAIILGLIQGLGEFLPISSSGHLVLAPWLFGFEDPGLAFDVALHLGTLIAVILYFWKDFITILISNFQFLISNPPAHFAGASARRAGEAGKISKSKLPITNYQLQNVKLLTLLIIATIPGALAGYLLEDYAETTFRNPLLVATTLTFLGLLLYLADKYARHIKNLNKLTKKEALLIGLSQAIAIIPGVSRSGATITTGLFLGLDRVSAARFSFLMSAPIIFGATILKFPDFIRTGITHVEIVGILTAALSGYMAIAFMIKFIEWISYKIFFWYRLGLALIIILIWLIK